MKQQERKHPPLNILYKGYYFSVSEPEIGSVLFIISKVQIKFQNHLKGYAYSAFKVLQHISYKTVISALSQTEPQIITALILPTGEGYDLKVKVKLQYINEIEEILVFKSEKIGEERRKQLKRNSKFREKIEEITKKLRQSQKQYVFGGVFNNQAKQVHQIVLEVPYNVTLNSITLAFKKLTSSIIRVGYYYFDKLTNSKVSENMLPDELFSHGVTEITLLAERSKFDRAVFTIEGEFEQADYLVKVEAVNYSKPINIPEMIFRVMAIGFCIWAFYAYNKYLGQDSGEV